MSDNALDLTGTWDGIYLYKDVPEAGPTTPFFATIKETRGAVTGTVIEPHELTMATIMATIIGHRSGHAVEFAKDYESPDEYYQETVQYSGTLTNDGQLITGDWRIGIWSGAFEMTRTPSIAEEATHKEAAWTDF